MTEACPLGLNYGHYGVPSYDTDNHEWHFPRQPGRTRELKQVGQPVIALQSPLQSPTAHIQSARERARNTRRLTHQYPELLPASDLLPELAQVSEAVDHITSGHDPTMSELLAIGEAVDPDDKHSRSNTFPIAAIAGGDAGEMLRLVLLTNEKLSWESGKNIRLSSFSSRRGEEGWWSGNRGPVQQLVFADAEGRPSSWLAVRYHGAVSVLRPQLRRNADTLSLAYAASSHYPPSRLNANHIATLPIDKTNGVPYADVTFNPWYNQRIATIDQKGTWAVWDVEKTTKQTKEKSLWTVEKIRDGYLSDVLLEGETSTSRISDGWGKVLWAGNLSTIVIARRRILGVFDIAGDPKRLSAPNLLSTTTAEYILDVKRSLQDSSQVFVATTSSIFWLQVIGSTGNHEAEEVAAGAKCLLSWTHFRDPEDLSLGLQVADDFEKGEVDDDKDTILVLLYSRLTGVTNVFTFQYAKSYSNLVPSASDPYLLRLPNNEPNVPVPRRNSHFSHRSSTVSTVLLKAVKYESRVGSIISGLGQTYIENDVAFYQLSLLTNDLTLYECLYADAPNALRSELHPPDKVSRLEMAKTPANVFSDFIVPSGHVDGEYEDSLHSLSAEEQSDAESGVSLGLVHEDPFTISFELLASEIRNRLTDANLTTGFRDYLDLLQDTIEEKSASGASTIKTLLCIEDASISVIDIDKASGEFVDFLDDIRRLTIEHDNGDNTAGDRQLMVSSILTPKLEETLGFRDTAELSSIHRHLVQTWIAQLSHHVPGRVRIALERLLRNVAGHICLASYAMRVDSATSDKDEKDQPDSIEASARFELPVRRRISVTDLGKGKERTDAVSTPPSASIQMSEDVGLMPQPAFAASSTPESNPSLRSRSSDSSIISSEDPATQRLRAYASLAPQPPLPIKLSNLLGQWQVGSDPTEYNWETAQQSAIAEDEGEDNLQTEQHQQAQSRCKKRRKTQSAGTVEPSSQLEPKPLVTSQPQPDHDTQNLQGSSQQTERAVAMSQVEPGKFGGRHAKNKRFKVKDRPAGFK